MNLFSKSFQLIHGFDLGYFIHVSHKIVRYEKLYYFLRSLFILFAPIPFYLREEFDITLIHLWVALHATHSYIYVMLFIRLPPNLKMCWFESEMEDVDRLLKCYKTSEIIRRKKILIVLLFYGFLLITMAHECGVMTQCTDKLMATFLNFFLLSGLQIINIMISFLFYSVQQRLIVLEKKLRESANDEMRYYFKIYRLISDITENFKDAYNIFFIIAILFEVPDVMITIFYAVWSWQHNLVTNWIAFSTNIVLTSAYMGTTLAPAISAGNIATQTERIKILLHNKVFDEKDELKRIELERFIRYVEARPLKFTVYKVIPLDASLLGIVLNFCVTYLIVIIQFSHLY